MEGARRPGWTLIGNMDEKIAREILERYDAVGIGFDTAGAYFFTDEYGMKDLEGKLAVNVAGRLKQFSGYISSELADVPYNEHGDFTGRFNSFASRIVIDSAVLEEVSHALGYVHYNVKKSSTHDFFHNLAKESHTF